MAGLLDVLNSDDGRMALGLLSAAGPSAVPMSFGQRLGGAMNSFRAQKMAEDEARAKMELQRAQLQDIAQQAALRQMQAQKMGVGMDMAQRLMGGSMGGAPQAMPQGLPSMMTGSGERTPEQNSANQGAVNQAIGAAQSPATMLSRLNEDQITGMISSGALPEKAFDIWKLAKMGEQRQPGTFVVKPDGTKEFTDDVKSGLGYKNGAVNVLPGWLQANAAITGAQKDAEMQATNRNTLAPDRPMAGSGAPFFGTTQQLIEQTRPIPGASPSVAAAIRRDMAATGVDPSSVQFNLGGNRSQGGSPIGFQSQAEKAAVENEAARQKQQMLIPGELDQSMVKKMSDAIEASSQRTLSAQGSLRAADQVEQGLKKAMVGTGADPRRAMAQIGYTLGAKSEEEALAATQNVIQGMAKMSLESRASLRGTGQISDKETELATKAASGTVSLTVPEIRQLVNTAKRVSNLQLAQHAELMKRSNANDWRTFFSEQGTPSANSVGGGSIDDLVNKYRSK